MAGRRCPLPVRQIVHPHPSGSRPVGAVLPPEGIEQSEGQALLFQRVKCQYTVSLAGNWLAAAARSSRADHAQDRVHDVPLGVLSDIRLEGVLSVAAVGARTLPTQRQSGLMDTRRSAAIRPTWPEAPTRPGLCRS